MLVYMINLHVAFCHSLMGSLHMVVTNPLGVSLVISSSKNKQIINHSPDTHTLTAAPKVSPSLAPSKASVPSPSTEQSHMEAEGSKRHQALHLF